MFNLIEKLIDVSSWSNLKKLVYPIAIRFSIFWFAIVPIAVNIIESAPQSIEIYEFKIRPELPFSWKIFWISALIYVIYTVIYFICCPQFIKNYSNLGEYRASGRLGVQLKEQIHDIFCRCDINEKKKFSKFLKRQGVFTKIYSDEQSYLELMPDTYENRLTHILDELFWEIHAIYDFRLPIIRIALIFIFLIGAALFLIVVAQNIAKVASQVIG